MAIEKKKQLIIGLIITGAFVGLVISLASTIMIPLAFDDDDHEEDDRDIETYDIKIETHNATMISTLSVTLNGGLVDMGNSSSVEVYFVWGEKPGDHTQETPRQTMTSPGMFSAMVEEIFMPDSTYYFQARSDPVASGEELSFLVY